MHIVLSVLALFVVSTLAACPNPPNFDVSKCGYSSSAKATTATLRTRFHMPVYPSTPNTNTYLCVRSLLETPFCDKVTNPAAGKDDYLQIRIPNVGFYNPPCHNKFQDTVPVVRTNFWATDAFQIPSVSNLTSFLDIIFYDSGKTTKTYRGVALSQLYITRVTYTDAQKADQKIFNDRWGLQGRLVGGAEPSDPVINDADFITGPALLPDVCNVGSGTYTVDLVYDFWKCAWGAYKEMPLDSKWNTQTKTSYCSCGLTGRFDQPADFLDDYIWWYGTCAACNKSKSDPAEQNFAQLPADNFDQDLDGVPDNCDKCEGFDDYLDTDKDGVPNSCDTCSGSPTDSVNRDSTDVNNNGIPDGCDMCALVGCGAGNTTCVNGPLPEQFSCTCGDVGYAIQPPNNRKWSKADAGTKLTSAANAKLIGDWLTSQSGIINYTIPIASVIKQSITNANTFTIDFSFRTSLEDWQTRNILDAFVTYVSGLLCPTTGNTCTLDFTLTYLWIQFDQSVESSYHTPVTFKFIPYRTSAFITNKVAPKCIDINECTLYGCGVGATCQQGLGGTRSCLCPAGKSGDRLLQGDEVFEGCSTKPDITDECALYGCAPSISGRVPGICKNSALNSKQRDCSCITGYLPAKTSLIGNARFDGCFEPDHCAQTTCPRNSLCSVEGEFPNRKGVCNCIAGYIKVGSGNTLKCIDPCTINNGGCQDGCVPPSNGNPYSCACNGDNAQINPFNPYQCVCVEPFLGDGVKCADQPECAFDYAFEIPFLSAPQSFRNNETLSPTCTHYQDNSCCDLTQPVFSLDFLDNFRGDTGCTDLLYQFYCSPCAGVQKQFSRQGPYLRMLICADFCQSIYDNCANAWLSSDDSQRSLTDGYSNPIKWCEEVLPQWFPFVNATTPKIPFELVIDATGLDKSECFAGASELAPFVALVVAVVALFAF